MNIINKFINLFKNSSLVKDSFWALLGQILGQGLSLLAGILVARFLGKEVYGKYGIIKTTLLQITIFSTFGLGYTITRFIAQYKNVENGASVKGLIDFSIVVTLIISSFMALLLFIFAKPIAIFINAPHLYNMLRLTALTIIFNAVNRTQIGVMAGINAFKIIAKNSIYVGIITFVLSTILTYFYGLSGAVLALTFSSSFSCIINNISIHNLLSFYNFALSHLCKSLRNEILTFSLPIALQESSYAIIHWVTIFVIISLSTYGELGIYNAALQWGGIITFLPGVLRNVMLSYFSESVNNKNRHKVLVQRMLLLNFTITSIIVLIISLFSNIISSLYGSTFSSMPVVLNVVAIASLFNAIISVLQQEFIAIAKNWFLFITRFFRDILLVVGTVIALKLWHIQDSLSVAIVSATLAGIYTIFLMLYYRKVIR